MSWLSVKDYAELKGISKQAIEKQIERGSIPEERVSYKEAHFKKGKRMIKHIKMED